MSPKRLPEQVMEALLNFLAEEPDLRVGQAIAIAASRLTGQCDPFSIEDEKMIKALQELTIEYRARKASR
ncbi:hypothetical protein OV208_26410 [Corallococcus sp. bb12-1]|uniref:hypothetical protein n=1 Tax=Corallococcus sp. bb12-1 TaxID=2996784 RepID=UPI0022719288|nr:hypothetical protein [Corallococcus sp. bb12-1]MCY1044877.1 hypothetical protein [Corallococcus sp. bb12-1]